MAAPIGNWTFGLLTQIGQSRPWGAIQIWAAMRRISAAQLLGATNGRFPIQRTRTIDPLPSFGPTSHQGRLF